MGEVRQLHRGHEEVGNRRDHAGSGDGGAPAISQGNRSGRSDFDGCERWVDVAIVAAVLEVFDGGGGLEQLAAHPVAAGARLAELEVAGEVMEAVSNAVAAGAAAAETLLKVLRPYMEMDIVAGVAIEVMPEPLGSRLRALATFVDASNGLGEW